MTDPHRLNGNRETLVSLREFIQSQFDSHNLLHAQHDQAHDREHRATDLAISKAEAATATALHRSREVVDERFKATDDKIKAQNELRAAMTDRERSFYTKAEAVPIHEAQNHRLDALEDAGIVRSTREQERERAMTRTMALIGLAATVGGFILSLLTRLLGVGP